jgi:DNA polymerase I
LKRILFDIEANGLLEEATKIHCIYATDVDSGEQVGVWGPNAIPEALAVLDTADVLIGHNIQKYDIPVMQKLHGFKTRRYPAIIDTFLCSRLIHPNISDLDQALVDRGRMPQIYAGSHSLAAWGFRTGQKKAEYSGGWAKWSQEMQDYMVQDVVANMALWRLLKVDSYSTAAVELEHRTALFCDAIEEDGVPFDLPKAEALCTTLRTKLKAVEDALKAQFGSWLAPVSPQAAKCVFVPKQNNAGRGYTANAPFSKLKQIDFNPSSRDHIAYVLRKRGWKPTLFTGTGKPQINEQVVANIVAQFPEMAGLGDFLMLEKRLSQIADGQRAWIKEVREDGRIHGHINPMGTTTSRGAHSGPNLGQVVAAASPYGLECRELFYVPPGWKLVGADMEGLELRGLSHYLFLHDQGKYAEAVLEGDVHWANTLSMGLATGARDKHNDLHTIMREQGAKRFVYAFVYGCGDVKAGEIVLEACLLAQRRGYPEPYAKFFGGEMLTDEDTLKRIGKRIRTAFLKRTVGLEDLKKKLERQLGKHQWVPGLDGRHVPVRAAHSALNFLIQSAGAILCKRWLCDVWDELHRRKYRRGWDGDFVYCLWVHDEVQIACREPLVDAIGEILVRHARAAGVPYGFRVQLDSNYKIGQTWADTH